MDICQPCAVGCRERRPGDRHRRPAVPAYDAAFSPDGTTLAAGYYDGSFTLFDVESGGERATIPGHRGPVGRLALGTHDLDLVRQIRSDAHGREGFEVHMLYGIRSADQLRMAADGYAVRTLISYGTHWYPW